MIPARLLPVDHPGTRGKGGRLTPIAIATRKGVTPPKLFDIAIGLLLGIEYTTESLTAHGLHPRQVRRWVKELRRLPGIVATYQGRQLELHLRWDGFVRTHRNVTYWQQDGAARRCTIPRSPRKK